MKCAICGKEVNKMMYSGNICSDGCFSKNFWSIVLNDPRTLIIEGNAYVVGDEHDMSSFRGFGGSTFYIRKMDGSFVKTTNLWHRGKIPEEYNVKDNAEWSDRKEYLYHIGILDLMHPASV